MAEIPEHTKSLVKNCMIKRLTTDEALDFLENERDISELKILIETVKKLKNQ